MHPSYRGAPVPRASFHVPRGSAPRASFHVPRGSAPRASFLVPWGSRPARFLPTARDRAACHEGCGCHPERSRGISAGSRRLAVAGSGSSYPLRLAHRSAGLPSRALPSTYRGAQPRALPSSYRGAPAPRASFLVPRGSRPARILDNRTRQEPRAATASRYVPMSSKRHPIADAHTEQGIARRAQQAYGFGISRAVSSVGQSVTLTP